MSQKTTAQDNAIEQIIEQIQHKEIFPGARLFETDLEKSLSMSRTPIRGALDQLVLDGILEKKHNQRGYFFPKLSIQDLYEAYIFRERLEVISVNLACLVWSRQHSKSVFAALEWESKISNTQIADTYKDISNGFHITVASITGNEYLVRTLKQVYLRICMYELFYGAREYSVSRNMEKSKTLNDTMIKEHEHIVSCIEAHNSASAERCLLQHLRNTLIVKEHISLYSQWKSYIKKYPS